MLLNKLVKFVEHLSNLLQ